MGLIEVCFKGGAYLVATVAVLIGCLVAGVPTQLGFWKWAAFGPMYPNLVGLAPAFHHDVKWGFTWDELDAIDLTGQTALVTGANSGVGYEMALALAQQKATLIMACRSPTKCEAAATKISEATKNEKVSTMVLDTSKLASVRAFGKAFSSPKLDMLFLNAGLASPAEKQGEKSTLSEDGIEIIFATNHVGHHLLYKLLSPALEAAPTARVVLTSSAAHYDSYAYGVATDLATLNGEPPSMKLYGQSKLAQVLFAQELTRQLGPESTIYVNSFHPGACESGIWEKNPEIPAMLQGVILKIQREFMWSARDGGLTGLYLGVKAHTDGIRGRYFHPQTYEVATSARATLELQKAVWEFSDSLVA
eukprot:m.117860 g.117860  ORF g.117860 m.117860 type:complete len:362 (-) comp28612_c0_seq1:70-1155(-)